MIRIVVLAAAIAPSLLILRYWIKRAGVNWGSEAFWSAFFLGSVSIFLALAVEFAISRLGLPDVDLPVMAAAGKAIFIVAIPEEAAKFFVLVVFAEKHIDARGFRDVIVLGLAVSLGFATVENFFYVTSLGDWKTVAGLRALTAVPGHGLDGLAMGALLASARLDGVRGHGLRDLWLARYALIAPVLLHAAYDFPLFAIEKHIAPTWFGTAWIMIVVLSWIFVVRLFNRVLAQAAFADATSPRDVASKANVASLMQSGAVGLMTGPLRQS